MLSNSHVSISTVRKNLKWLWLTAPALPVLAAVRSYFVLQLLSAGLLFTLLFATLAALTALFVLLLVAAYHALEWAAAQLVSPGRVSSHRFAMSGNFGYGRRTFLTRSLGGRRGIKRLA
jgi:hypothetical protein